MTKRRRRKKSLTSDIAGFTGAGVGLGVGTAIVSKAGAPSGVTSAFGTMGGLMRPVGMTMMAGHAMRGVRKLQPRRRKKKRKQR